MQVKLLQFGHKKKKKKKIGYHLTVALTIHSYITIRSIVEEVPIQWCHQSINRTKLWLFFLADLHSEIDNSTYLRIHWAKTQFAAEHNFSIKKWIFRQLSNDATCP